MKSRKPSPLSARLRPRSPRLAALALMLGALLPAPPLAASEPDSGEILYIANLENGTEPKVRYSGKAWSVNSEGFLTGRGNGHQAMMVPAPGAGDFRFEAEFLLPQKGKKSAVTLGYDSRIELTSGSGDLILKGRFFRIGEDPVEVHAAPIPATTRRMLVLERMGSQLRIALDGRPVHTGPCNPGALALLGFDPGEGQVQLIAVSARGVLLEAGERAFANAFGMQQRKAPQSAQEVRTPVIVHPGPTNECSMVARRDGTLELYHATKPASDSISVIRSRDGGLTWEPSQVVLPLPGKIYYAVIATEARDGKVHLIFHIAGEGPGGYRNRLYDVYHTRTTPDGSGWEAPKRIIPGYVGSIRGLAELPSGRLVLSVGLAAPERMEAPKSGIDYGWNDVVTCFSDDEGSTWSRSPDRLKLPLSGQNTTRYGAIEPALIPLEDGRLWMLIRSRDGRFWQSFSKDGSRWSEPERTTFITSDSPASFIKLRNKQIVLLANACQNWTNPRSYAMGGREVLQAALSTDDGKTWHGFREVLHESVQPAGGDRGTAYASGVETRDGKICFFGGQGEGNRAIVLFDPAWLLENETSATDDLASWSQYGDDGLSRELLPSGTPAAVVPLKSSGLCGALWNFPAMTRGEISFRLFVPGKAKSVTMALSDHFTRVDDLKAAENSPFHLPLETAAGFRTEDWQEITIRWTDKEASVSLNKQPATTLPLSKLAPHGLNYLRIEARSASDEGALKISDLQARRP